MSLALRSIRIKKNEREIKIAFIIILKIILTTINCVS